ncbi:putative dynamin-like GTPase mitochondrial precursor [Cercophora samala]|uniref:dynamin GTPase n=1 Tax=Cercophora samala TaxID=330535 RepID=A0AA39ZDR9_9PEZI|nr:putative dynamin-like GTPase mitochondrial precursor [Cercophora samala]
MSAQLRAAGAIAPVARRVGLRAVRQFHQFPTGGIQRADLAARDLRRSVQFPAKLYHNAVMVRNASFVRLLPKLAIKFVRIPALFGGLMLGAAGWVQYQAIQLGNSATEMYTNVKTGVTDTAFAIWGTATDIANQTKKGFNEKKGQFTMPEWLDNIMKGEGAAGGGSGGPNGGSEPPKQSRVAGGAAAAGASAAAYGYGAAEEDDDRSPEEVSKDDHMMYITKRMIEIRNLLSRVGQSSSVTLPSIVVIGSQSSGKSSVLEAIVGHEFLPKGSNMITRRPIELTLVNDPQAKVDYGEFPDLGLARVTDFSLIQKTLTELNQSVPESQCVSDDPIRLTIHSPRVPDLSLIDLPGYIQVAGENQPRELKRKISELCDKYIRGPNIILAISAADTDLANSTALQASRRVDPRGERTIGVITKMDLVDPEKGAAILGDKQYPLRLGYVGVISKMPVQTGGLFRRESNNLLASINKNEKAFFNSHPEEFGPNSGAATGTITLRKKLMHVLEQQMSSKLTETTDAITRELEETTYQFKVQYNEQPMSAESYLAASLDDFKHQFHNFANTFGRQQLLELLKDSLDQKVLDQLAARYWNKPIEDLFIAPAEPDSLADLPKADPKSPYWHRQLDTACSGLTRLGVGRLAATVASNAIQANIDKLLDKSSFAKHPSARQVISEAAALVLADRAYATSDGIEISLKPYKFDPDIQPNEWEKGREHVVGVLQGELDQCQNAIKSLENSVGGRKKLREVMSFVDKARKGEIIIEGDHPSGAGGFSAALLARGREAVFLRDRADIINMRILASKSRKCKSLENKYYCPEIFLDAVATKLAQTAVLFLNVEMLNDFYHRFPREVETKLNEYMNSHGGNGLEKFAREDPKIRRHLDLVQRKELLELVLMKIQDLHRFDAAGNVKPDRDYMKKGRGGQRGRWSF